LRAVIYARVSTDEQATRGYSLEDQVERCTAHARELGAIQVEIFRDVESGSVLTRPGLLAARERVARGGVELFVCYDPDRLARNLSHQLLLTEEIESRGTRLEFVNFAWKNTPEGKLFYSLRGAIAEYEKEKIRERTVRGKLRKLREGRLTHDPRTYGYRFDRERDTLLVVPEEATVVRRIFSWYADENLGCGAIVSRLASLGILPPRGRSWHRSTVSRILRNPAYIGSACFHRYNAEGVHATRRLPPGQRVLRKERPPEEWVEVPVPAIVDRELFERAQEKHRMARRLWAGKSRTQYLLRGLVWCGVCGGRINGNLITSKAKKRRYYVCRAGTARAQGGRAGPACTLGYIPADDLERAVWYVVLTALSDPDAYRRDLQERTREACLYLNTTVEGIQEQICRWAERRRRLLELYEKGVIHLGEVEERLAQLGRLVAELTRRRDDLLRNGPPVVVPTDPARLEHVAAKLVERLGRLGFEERQTLVRTLVAGLTVLPDAVILHVRWPAGAAVSGKVASCV